MVQDGQVNALLYPVQTRISGKMMFQPYIDFCMELQEKGVHLAKRLRNILWGALCQRRRGYHSTKEGEVSVQMIEKLQPLGEHYRVISCDPDRIFSTDYARLGPFLTSSGRQMLAETIQPLGDRVKAYHTDGFIVQGTIESDKIGNNLGDLAIKHKGHVKIHHANKLKWAEKGT